MALTCLILLSMHRREENKHVIMIATFDSYTVKDWTAEQTKSLVDKIETTQP